MQDLNHIGELSKLTQLGDLKTEVAIIKQKVSDHDADITRLEKVVTDLDMDIREMKRELGEKIDSLHKDALTSVPEWAARELKKSGASNGTLLTIIGILSTAVVALLVKLFHN